LAKAKDFCSRPRPRTTFKAKAKAKDSKFVLKDKGYLKAKDNNTAHNNRP